MKTEVLTLSELGKQGSTVHAVVVKVDETCFWIEEIQKKAKGRIFGLYLVDLTQPTHCCSLSVDYPSYFIRNHFENVESWQDENGEWLDTVDELTDHEDCSDGGDFKYFSQYSEFEVVAKVDYKEGEFEELLAFMDDDREQAHNAWIEELIEHYQGNSPV